MSFPVAKVVIGLGAASGATGLGYLSFRYLSPSEDDRPSVAKLFKEQGRTLLVRSSDADQWNARWAEYVREGSNSWELSDYESKKGNTNMAPDSFINKCISNSESKVSSTKDSLYLEVVKHCSKEFSVSHFVSQNSGVQLLDTTTGQDSEGWNSAWKNYLADNGSNNFWSVNGWVSGTQPAEAPEGFRTQCNSKKDEKILWAKDDKLLKFTKWCTKTVPPSGS